MVRHPTYIFYSPCPPNYVMKTSQPLETKNIKIFGDKVFKKVVNFKRLNR